MELGIFSKFAELGGSQCYSIWSPNRREFGPELEYIFGPN